MNCKLTIQYDGSRYDGWQRQGNTANTIQGKLEGVLSQLAEASVDVQGAGRTDAGVHALGQVASVRLPDGHTPTQVMDYLNRYLPEDIDALQEGSVLRIHDQGDTTVTKLTVTSIDRDADNGYVTINGGIEAGGVELTLDHDVYRTVTFDDYPVYYEMGEVTLPLAGGVTLSDSSADPQASAVETDGADAVAEAVNAEPDGWMPNNTLVFTEDGTISSIVRIWVP